MNEELIKQALDLLKNTKDFAIEQAPDFIRQILAWELAKSLVGVAGGSIFLLMALALVCYAHKTKNEGPLVGAALLAVPGAVISIANFMDFLKIHFAPKLYLLEYFAALLKGR